MRFCPKEVLLAGIILCGLAGVASARSGFKWEELEQIDQRWPQAKVTATGLRYVVEREGQGECPKSGDNVKVLYKGMFFDGRVFDQSLDPAKPFTFRLGRSQIIDGWEEGIAQMKVGEKRVLIVPYDLAYGARGQPPAIPRQTSLIFEVEVLAIEAFEVPASKQPRQP